MNRVICLFCNGLMLCGPLPARALEPISAMPVIAQTTSGESKISHDGKVDFRPYMANMQKVIKSKWSPPRLVRDFTTVVAYRIHSDGRIDNLRITQSSGKAKLDDAALKAVVSSSPLLKLPAGAPPSVDVEFHFEYRSLHKRHAS